MIWYQPKYKIQETERPDGRVIWRLYWKICDGDSWQGFAAFDSKKDAEKYLADRKARDARLAKRW